MNYARLDPSLLDHPKWEQLSDAAFRLGIRALCWARKPDRSRYQGFVPAGMLVSLARRSPALAARLADELINAGKPDHECGIWEPTQGGWMIHDFEDYEPADSAAAQVPTKSDVGRLGGIRSAEVRRERGGSAQPRNTEVASSPTAGHELLAEATPEASVEAAPKQDGFASTGQLGFPPDPLSESKNGSGSEEAVNGDSGSGSKSPITLLVSSGAREAAAKPALAAVENIPPGRTRKVSKRPTAWRRVPADWFVKDSHRTLALQLIVDVELEEAKYRDHEFHRPRTDPDATFRNWLREAANRPRPRLGMGPKVTNAGTALIARAARIAEGADE